MAKLVKEFELGNTFTRTIYLAKSKDFENPMDDKEWNTIFPQGFVWYRNFVAFTGIQGINNIGVYWVRILISTSLDLEANSDSAIVVPFQVPSGNELYLYDEGEDELIPFPILRTAF